MKGFFDDLRYGLRGLAKNRGFALAAVLSLALGIGANTTIFTLLNALFLRPLPVHDPARLAAVFTTDPRIPGLLLCSYPNYLDYRDHNTVFSSLLLYCRADGEPDRPRRPATADGPTGVGQLLRDPRRGPGVGARLPPGGGCAGRLAGGGDQPRACGSELFGGSRDVTRRTIEISGHPYGIIGVAPAGFLGLNQMSGADIFLPLSAYPQVYPVPGRWRSAARCCLPWWGG